MIRLAYANVATDETIRLFVEDNVIPTMCKTRDDRIPLQERWLRFWKIWNVELDDQGYLGRSKTYLPAGKNAMETWVTALMQGLFPQSEWFGVDAVHGVGTEETARAWQAMQRDFLNKRMQVRRKFPLFLRQYVTYGTAIFEQLWEEEYVKTRFWEKRVDNPSAYGLEEYNEDELVREEHEDINGEESELSLKLRLRDGSKICLVEKEVPVHVGPTMRTLDLFRFFVFPMTAEDLQKAIMCFEDIETTIEDIERASKLWMDENHHDMGHIYENIEEMVACGGKLNDDQLSVRQERQQKWLVNADPNINYRHMAKGHVNLSKVYWRGEIPGAVDPVTGEEYGYTDWHFIVVNDTFLLRAHPNHFYTKKRPYQEARLLRVVDEYYGRGVAEAMASLQFMLNDVGNMTLDNIVNALNPIILIDPDKVETLESLTIAPNAKWFVQPDGVQFVSPPNVAQIGMATMNMMQGFMQDASQASFVTQGQAPVHGRGRAAQTASGMSLLLGQNHQAFQFALSEIEEQCMIPMLEWNYCLAEQFMTDKLPLIISGAPGVPLMERNTGFEDIFGKYLYTWKGAQGVRESMVLTQQMQNFTQMAVSIRQADPTAQFRINWGVAMKDFIEKGMGLPDARKWIETPDDNPPLPPEVQIALCKAHRAPKVGPFDDHMGSIEAMNAALVSDPVFARDLTAQTLLKKAISEHERAMMEMLMQMMTAQQGPAGAQGGSMPSVEPPSGETDLMADAARSTALG